MMRIEKSVVRWNSEREESLLSPNNVLFRVSERGLNGVAKWKGESRGREGRGREGMRIAETEKGQTRRGGGGVDRRSVWNWRSDNE